MKPRIYVETSVVSYASARLSRDLITASRQRITRRWLALRGSAYQPCISDLVLREAERGDAIAAQRRLRLCEEFPLLRITAEAESLAARLIASNAVPKQEPEDALHIALATTAGVDFVATWNFAHLVGPSAKYRLMRAIESLGFRPPVLATPEELYEELS